MDKILSTRLNESIVHAIDMLAKTLHTSKKNVIESAITLYVQSAAKNNNVDMFKLTCGAWQRKKSARATVKKTRKVFQQSMLRHQS